MCHTFKYSEHQFPLSDDTEVRVRVSVDVSVLDESCRSYRTVHHVGLAVPQTLHSMKDVNNVLPLDHFTHNTDGTEHPTAAASVPADTQMSVRNGCFSPYCTTVQTIVT